MATPRSGATSGTRQSGGGQPDRRAAANPARRGPSSASGASPSDQPRAGRVPRLDSLTGLRFVAALLVFVSHTLATFEFTPYYRQMEPYLEPGAAGVSFFFILSGFVLTWTHRAGDRVGPFYRRRFARIAPAYWVAVLAFIPLNAIANPEETGSLLRHMAPQFLGLHAWFPDSEYYWAGNGVTWSISCEMFFYALFPLLIVGALRLSGRARWWAAGVLAALVIVPPVVLAPLTHGATVADWAIFIFPVQRLWEFCLGILIALWIKQGGRIRLGLPVALALVAVAYAIAIPAPAYLIWVAIPFIPFALVIATAAQADLDGRPSVFRHPVLVKLGEWSFAFYLTHQLVIRVVDYLLEPSTVAGAIGASLLALVGSVASAYVLYTVVEKPLERRLRGGTLPVSHGGSGHVQKR
ncbi:acyltransferase family protein [Blastococcus xanthinilyticus]|uniref:Peptidoglycan/LPS O-acetylase OafA/YrhL n=1 Tax=Blastococcus xanthinilyticus TaxID=1564164 RepID=A0A5S5CUB0_9ACTN|nr:acyltransferase [Blastococcus xanthinilyticus]TYP87195.1 peptidoglycan/LPS O-acetylase OafA/YrhL [Blastococcus xanthinilyticus]